MKIKEVCENISRMTYAYINPDTKQPTVVPSKHYKDILDQPVEVLVNDQVKKQKNSIDDYLKLIEALKKETFDIDVRFGLEVCYTPETESLLSSILKNYHFDFLIGSVHSVNGYLYDMDAFSKELLWNKNDPSNIYKSYYDAIEKLMA